VVERPGRRSTVAAVNLDLYTFGIVGMGPRGSYALECLLASLADSPHLSRVRLVLFDDASHVGAGPVYDLDQPESNWINISERALELDGRPALDVDGAHVDAFPSYHEWVGLPHEEWPADLADSFPPRAQLGSYLHARAQSLIGPLVQAGVATFVEDRVQHVSRLDGRWCLRDTHGREWSADEVLLTVGHQPTAADDQIIAWRETVGPDAKAVLYSEPYPIEPIVDHARMLDGDITVAIRGYGLAMMDVVRGLALEFGEFVTSNDDEGELVYDQTRGGRLQLVPFSLDGLPMGPKPRTPADDARFAPTDEELTLLDDTLGDRDAQARATSDEFLIDAIVPIAARVFSDLPDRHEAAPSSIDDVESLLGAWLRDADTEHPALGDAAHPPESVLRELVAMAVGEAPITLDYCLGQVWRQCHPTIYSSLSHNVLSADALAATISLDERIKRYSFGPPVESLRQLCALAAAGVLRLEFVDDPEIECTTAGWTLSSNGTTVTAEAMVDSVLDAPRLETVVAPVVTDLLSESVIRPVHDELGIATDDDATVRSLHPEASRTLSVLGRLAKGTVVGVDAILECFGDRPRAWADGARSRLLDSTT
jgi:uncharacterized NAD(P)/FAD-binding protein YdhS